MAKSKNDVQNQIREELKATLLSHNENVRRAAASAIAQFAIVDLQAGQWLDIIEWLTNVALDQERPLAQEAALTTLGYICENLVDMKIRLPAVRSQAHLILKCVFQGMRSQHGGVRVSAVTAMYNSIEFINENFKIPNERNAIIQVINENTQYPHIPEVRLKSMQCLIKIVHYHYEIIEEYMTKFKQITFHAASIDEEIIATQAIEFWNKIADKERKILKADDQHIRYLGLIAKHKNDLLGVIQKLMMNQNAYQTDNDMNRSASAGTCLSLISHIVGKEIINDISGYLFQNVTHQDWRVRESAILAFSAVIEGVKPSKKMNATCTEAIHKLLPYFKDEVMLVRDTAVFAVGRIAENHSDSIMENQAMVDLVVPSLAQALQDEPQVASKAAWSLTQIAKNVSDHKINNPLTKFLEPLIRDLLMRSDKNDSTEENLSLNLFECLESIISHAKHSSYQHLHDVVVKEVLNRIQAYSNMNPPNNQLITGLLTALEALITRLDVRINNYADAIMDLLMHILEKIKGVPRHYAYLCIGSLAVVIGKHFQTYLNRFVPLWFNDMKNFHAIEDCTITLNLIQDISSGLKGDFKILENDIMEIVMNHLTNRDIDASLKPIVVSAVSEIALGLEMNIVPYIRRICPILEYLSSYKANPDNEEDVDYMNSLRESILIAYSGLIQGPKLNPPRELLENLEGLRNLLQKVALDELTYSEVFATALSVIGDLANVYKNDVRQLLYDPFIDNMIAKGCANKEYEIYKEGRYARKERRALDPEQGNYGPPQHHQGGPPPPHHHQQGPPPHHGGPPPHHHQQPPPHHGGPPP
eukprot:CAMPEP_0117432868 /NCGR_PEP_ID=MMETSP0758-20121206/12289_1 /TAXON_ID=63605 /ORGANISM="Percolomonas cosmopolitus, Strain AE-1 (ATCC 50343)" /LENGTH=814 /DNA_ID=CAMNT_0005223081 /DNA_START=246 /DNA_END=2688 /DNA_ORIENTATION=+